MGTAEGATPGSHMTEKLCANCGEINSADTNYCSNCGYSRFNDVPPELHARLADEAMPARDPAVLISGNRVVIASLLSGGIYLFYWFYVTWKHMSPETENPEDNYPVWHALTLFVPVYGLFRMHAHVRTINELAFRHRIPETFAPGLAVLLLVLSYALNWASFGVTNYVATIAVSIIDAALVTALMKMAQGVLNQYWEKTFPPGSLRYARIGVGEVTWVIVGIFFWIIVLIPPSVFERSDTGF